MVSDILVDNEAHVVISSISRIAGSVLDDAYRGRVCIRTFIGVSVFALCECLSCTV